MRAVETVLRLICRCLGSANTESIPLRVMANMCGFSNKILILWLAHLCILLWDMNGAERTGTGVSLSCQRQVWIQRLVRDETYSEHAVIPDKPTRKYA